jgi:predicted ATPase with chaperone activity
MNDDPMKVDLTTSDDEMMDTTVATLSASTPSILPDDKENNRTSASLQYNIPWVEKFRPRTLQDVLGNEETVLRLRAIAKDGNLPNLILCGPPGTGTLLLFCFSYQCEISEVHSEPLMFSN